LGSRGSVVPIFAEQRVNGTLRITDPRMTRFWITLDQGVQFVIRCIERMHGGEVFIPKLPSMKTSDLARAIAPEARIEYIGMRPGEKLHESLVSEEEGRMTVDAGDCYVTLPENWLRSGHRLDEVGTPLMDRFKYTSDTNKRWLSPSEIRDLVDAAESNTV
jgi:UDP-N-acetylglucosamine 4,6-dehydratase